MSIVETHSILVATGLGADSDAPIRVAGLLAERSGARLHLMHALELQSMAPAIEAGEAPPDFQTLIERTRNELELQAQRAVPEGIVPESREVIIYVPYRAILDRASQVDADLIVLGAHRRRPRGDLLLGPTPDRVIRSAAAPVLIVPEVRPKSFQRIVAPIDIEMPTAAALDLAQIWAEEFGPDEGQAIIDLIYIAPDRGSSEAEANEDARIEEALKKEIERSKRRIAERIGIEPSAERLEIRPVIRRGGAPADALTDYAEEVDADLVVLGTRGFGAIRRALIGSVASTIARRAPAPILLVPPVLWRARS